MRRLIAGIVLASLTVTGIAAPAAAAEPPPNVVQRLVLLNRETRDFDTLLVLVLCPSFGGLVVDALNGPETRTLFAPTDAAFVEDVDLDTVEALGVCATADPDILAELLGFHVRDGKTTYDDVRRALGSSLTMLSGAPADVTGTRSQPLIAGAGFVRKNVKASNGLIHVMNGVLIPPCFYAPRPILMEVQADC